MNSFSFFLSELIVNRILIVFLIKLSIIYYIIIIIIITYSHTNKEFVFVVVYVVLVLLFRGVYLLQGPPSMIADSGRG